MAGWQSQLIGWGRSTARLVVDTVLPPTDDTARFSDLTFLDDPCCASCGYPFDHQTVGLAAYDLQCGSCLARRPAFATARSAFQYDDQSRPMILSFKHGGQTDRLESFAAQMQRAGRVALVEADFLLPVPLHRLRLIRRRYNQSALLARALSKRTHVPVCTTALLRTKRTPSQGGLSAVGRRRNVSGAFTVADPGTIKDKRLILIDDVMTTGATLNACARVLKRAGAARLLSRTLS